MATAVGGRLPPVRAVPPRVGWRRIYTLLVATLTSSTTYMAGLSLPGRLLSGMLPDQRNEDANRAMRRSGQHLLLSGTVSAPISFQAAMNPPDMFWQGESTGAHYRSDDFPHQRFLVYLCFNGSAFVLSLAIILIILVRDVFGAQGIKCYRALHIAMILDLFSLIGSFIAMTLDRQIVLWVFLCVLLLLAVFRKQARARRQAFREKIELYVPRRLKMWSNDPEEDEENRQLLLLLAIFAAIPAYHAGPSFRPDDRFNYYRCLVFSYCKSAIFFASQSIIAMLVNRKLPSARGLRWHALRLSAILVVIGLTGAFATGGYRKISTIDVHHLHLAVLRCIAFQVALSITGTVGGLVQTLAASLGAAEEEDGYEDELEFGIAEEPLGAVEISSPILGGALTLIIAVPLMSIFTTPMKLLVAIMIASIGMPLWRRSFTPLLRPLSRALRRRCTLNLQGTTPAPAPTGSSTPREQLVSALCHGLYKAIHTLRSGTWMLIPILAICVPSLRHNLKLKLKISKITAVLGLGVQDVGAPPTATPTTGTVTATGVSTTATTTSSTVAGTPTSTGTVTATGVSTTTARTTSRSRGRRDVPLVEARPRRNRRPNSRLTGQDWVN